ncbi:phenylalanine 4-monooxygenase [Endozoicomonas numazuensis]|uniref:Phenylalanine-4-hydroxylase n=1 Tax=Endozoicomonas numazuensis TaxID=1137799 RepID=A0A081NCF7_9GAMM|nr:phenylalanine 4-monooxygenase [Endozoicomonas numazuensis]KEQ16130.1 phenylalanine 4-monooxygenase [Endozoicomonas numazuensis]
MKKPTQYVARKPDEHGFIEYPAEEHETWRILYERQIKVIENRACLEFIDGLDILGLSAEAIPQLNDINEKLRDCTGWSVARVPALISFDRFFELLANRQFPVATFIRTREELDYLQEPDIFHEVFGHCPLLTNPDFAQLTAIYGELGLKASKEERIYLARLYWMTVEFGLVATRDGLRIYGGGILSSYKETLYALESSDPDRLPFDILEALRTPYRIDILQPVYFIIQSLSELHSLTEMDLMAKVHESMKLGLLEPKFPPKTA